MTWTKREIFADGNKNRILHERTAAATEWSIEGSLKRWDVDRIDILRVHDIAQEFHGDAWLGRFEEARTGAYRVPARLRDEGVIKARGPGVHRTEPIELTSAPDEPRPDGFLPTGRYSLLDHEHAQRRLLPMAQEQGVRRVGMSWGPRGRPPHLGGEHPWPRPR
ncbi:aldo/keto reductase [Streptomyces sp. NBC_01497]|uniref:aldo/keto reductase n=1 Tax=Streptomyces sp. NBC_01497 TaxID=2903885 RepID=UPI002E310798|nr:aldo/keto reductase [Streptomyces sp. NBC_01497]